VAAKSTRCGAARCASSCSPETPVLVEGEEAEALRALARVVADVPVLLRGRPGQGPGRRLQFLALAAGGAHEGDDGQQLPVAVGGRGHGSSRTRCGRRRLYQRG
jgi:hypothetical protein